MRDVKDAKSTIEEVYNSFQGLRDLDTKYASVLYGTHDQYLTDALKEMGFTSLVPSPGPANPRWAKDAATQILNHDLYTRVTPRQPRAQGRADALNVLASWAWQQIDPGSRTLEQIVDSLVKRPFAAIWPCLNPWGGPDDMDGYFPLRLEVTNGRDSAFLEDQGIVSLAVRCMEKPVVQIARDYNKRPKDDRNPLRIFDEDFPGLRATFGTGKYDGESVLLRKLKVWAVDDGSCMEHWVEGDGVWHDEPITNSKDKYRWDNPLGRPLFHFACGYWNPDAERPEDRYMAFLLPLLRQAFKRDLNESIGRSLMASMPVRMISMPDTMLDELKTYDTPQQKAEFLQGVSMLEARGALLHFGQVKQLDMPVPELLAEAIKADSEEFLRLLPAQPPSEVTLRESTATGLAVHQEYKAQTYQSPLRNVARAVHDCIEDFFDICRVSDKSIFRNTPKAKTYIEVSGMTSGDEKVMGKKIKPGSGVVAGPEQLGENDNWYTLYVEPVDMSAQAVAARRADAAERKALGAIDEEQFLEGLDTADVTEQVKRLAIDRRTKMFEGPLDATGLAKSVVLFSLQTGIKVGDILGTLQGGLGGGGGAPAMQDGQQQAQQEASNGFYSVQPPQNNAAPMAVA